MSKEEKTIRVVIVDDHLMVRVGLRMMLEMSEGVEVVGEASDGVEAIRIAGEQQPHVILMDIRMPDTDGLEALIQIRKQWANIAVLILTTYNEDALIIRGLQSGACGYLLKDINQKALLQGIRKAACGEILIQPEIMERILKQAAHATQEKSFISTNRTRGRYQNDLTERELDVLSAVARGERNKEIAMRFKVSERTIWAYLTTIYTKLNVDSRTSAVAAAVERGLLPRTK